MVSPLPAEAGANPEAAVADYMLSLVRHLQPTVSVDIIAQQSAKSLNKENHISVSRSWQPGIFAAKDIVNTLSKTDASLIHLQHEFRIFGDVLSTGAVVEMLRRSRKIKIPVVTTLHAVVPISGVTREFLERTEIPLYPKLAQKAFQVAFRSVRLLSAATVVHHQLFKDILVSDYNFDKSSVEVIPLGVSSLANSGVDVSGKVSTVSGDPLTKNVLFFGYLASYKQPELLVQAARILSDAPIHFTFCVSENPRTPSKAYQDRYRALRNSVIELGDKATWSGYVPDEEVPRFFEDADLLILPYVDCISVSAVAALAYSHGAAICHSAPLNKLFPTSNLEFQLTPSSLAEVIIRGPKKASVNSGGGGSLPTWSDSAIKTETLWRYVLSSRTPGHEAL